MAFMTLSRPQLPMQRKSEEIAAVGRGTLQRASGYTWLLGVVTLLKRGKIVSASADLDFALV